MNRKFIRAFPIVLVLMSVFLAQVNADWKDEWNKILEAARKEGKVAVAGPPGAPYRDVMRGFEEKYPDIALEYQGFTPRTFTARFTKEKQAGQHLWDVYITGPTSFDIEAKEAGDLASVKETLVLPEVTDETVWLGGFSKAFLDKENQYVFAFQAQETPQVYVNRDLVSVEELNSIEGLLDPKWKGKIALHDPRVNGAGNGRMAFWLGLLGEDFVRKLLQQDVQISRDQRQLTEWIVRGKYPIAAGIGDTELFDLQKDGLGKNVVPLGGKSPAAWRLSTGWGGVRLLNKAPHPNAARVFINWLLSKEGQTAWMKKAGRPSRRVDVERIEGLSPQPGIDYYDIDREGRLELRDKAKEIAKEVLGS